MAKPREDYDLESGLADDFDATIGDAYFGTDSRYAEISGSEDPMLTLVLNSPDFEQPQETRYSTGGAKKWQTIRNGKEITSQLKPDSHRFNSSSRAGNLVARLFELVGNGDKAKGQDFFISRDRYMTEAEFYTGLNFHWKREKMRTLEEGVTKDVLMPSKYLGEAQVHKTKAATVQAAADTSALDATLVDIVGDKGLTDKEIKQAALKNASLKANTSYMQTVISGSKLKELEEGGKIFKGDDGKYLKVA